MISELEEGGFAGLTPDVVLDAVEAQGLNTDGRLLPLNSYENRVYQLWLTEAHPAFGSKLVVKIYRNGRWSDEQIQEEHDFALELQASEIPSIAPVEFGAQRSTLLHHQGFRFALFPSKGGRAPDLENIEQLKQLGRWIGRIHQVGRRKPFRFREELTPASQGRQSIEYLLAETQSRELIPRELLTSWETVATQAQQLVEERWRVCSASTVRLHGDLHLGNILWGEAGGFFVDLDDARQGPPVQDLWMLLGESAAQRAALLEGYQQFQDFDWAQLQLVEPLRTLRLLHYSAWIARRWGDPAFPRAFPWFGTIKYWQDRILELREQVGLLQESLDSGLL